MSPAGGPGALSAQVCLPQDRERAMEVPPPAPRSFLYRALGPFPRVFAAENVAADSEALAENRKLPSYVPERYYPESGWDRLRELFVKDEQQRTSKELENIYRAAISAGIIGWAYGGIPAFIHAKKSYIEQSQAQIYHNRFDAVQSAHRAATRGFIRYGWRWSWRTAVFVTIFNTVNTSLNVYRNKNALSHFVIAGVAPTDLRGCEPPDAVFQHGATGSSVGGTETEEGRNGGTTPSLAPFTTLFPCVQGPKLGFRFKFSACNRYISIK
ncbi:complex I assembly factor TIMMDC1, mitochondrial isoform X3 [Oryctolagus cuniculus]|uniref:complex I assembly factor TIMMDC1, mitochondrial isoform X3 n=1 Tax=Oryctolagus cuniculus TaxID=9986 RepID=UPI00387A542A